MAKNEDTPTVPPPIFLPKIFLPFLRFPISDLPSVIQLSDKAHRHHRFPRVASPESPFAPPKGRTATAHRQRYLLVLPGDARQPPSSRLPRQNATLCDTIAASHCRKPRFSGDFPHSASPPVEFSCDRMRHRATVMRQNATPRHPCRKECRRARLSPIFPHLRVVKCCRCCTCCTPTFVRSPATDCDTLRHIRGVAPSQTSFFRGFSASRIPSSGDFLRQNATPCDCDATECEA